MAKIQVRRGTKVQLETLTSGSFLDAGELGFTTDTQEVFVGTGLTNATKHLIGKVMVDVFSNRPTAGVSGRMFHASDTDVTYVDDGSAWIDVSSGISTIDDVDDGTTYVRTKAGAVDSGYIVQLTDNAGANPLTKTTIDTHLGDATKHFIIDDADVKADEVWSSQKVQDEIAAVISGIDPQESVIAQSDLTSTVTPSTGDRYINTTTGTAADGGGGIIVNNIYEWNGTTWDETTVSEGMHTWDETLDAAYIYNGTSWVKFGSTVTHNNLSGLNADDYKHLTAVEYGGLHDESHTVVSHSDTTATGAELDELTDGSTTSLHDHANDHAEAHTIASHNDTTATGAELETLTDGSDADSLHTHSAVGSHTIASHNDTTATGAELETLTNGSETTLHSHALSANDHVAATVLDTTSIDLTLTGQQISADLLLADGGSFV